MILFHTGLLEHRMENIKLEFNVQDMQIIQAGLFELPYRISAPLIEKIDKQVQAAQIQADYDANES
jgi:hypothetical protein